MPSYSGKRTYEMTTKKWGGRNPNQRRDDRRPPLQNRIAGGSRPMVNPWENGVTPGMQSSLLGQGSFAQPIASSYLMNSGMNRGSFGAANYGGGFGTDANKLRHLDRMGGFDDQRGRGLLPSPSNAPLLGVAPPTAFVPPGRGTEFLQHRMGNPWDSSSSSSFRSGGGVPRGLNNSGYYPSNRGRQDNNNSRKFLKAKRPPQNNTNNKSSSSSSTSTSRSGGSKESRGGGRTKGSTSSSKSPSKGEDKDRDSSSAHSKSGNNNKQGDLPAKRERLDKDEEEGEKEGAEEGKESVEGEEVKMEEEEDGEKKDEQKNEDERKEKEKQEDPFPVEALYCHICELDSFSSKKGYIRHLQGITHAKMAEMFHAKNAATLELLNISAKLAEMRQRDKVLRRTGKKGQPVAKTTEQILVQKWLKVGSCCGTKYKSPFGLEEHKLSIHHLKAKFTPKPKDEEKEEKSDKTETEEGDTEELKEVKKEIEEQFVEDSHDEVLNQSALIENAQKESEKNPITMENIPAYNPSVMMGLEYILKELRFRCRVCKGQGFKSLENHCQSHSHFDNIASHLNKIEDMKREEKRKQEEAEEEAKKEQERLEKEKEEKAKKEKEKVEKDAKMEEEEGEGGLSSDFITLDDCAKDKSDDEEMDEDAILLGEEEERIFNSKEEADEDQEEEEEEEATGGNEEEDDDDVLMEAEIFEEVGEKIDFDGDLKKQLENGDEEEEEEEAKEVEPPQKKPASTPRGRRGRSRGRGRWAK